MTQGLHVKFNEKPPVSCKVSRLNGNGRDKGGGTQVTDIQRNQPVETQPGCAKDYDNTMTCNKGKCSQEYPEHTGN